MKTEYNGHRKWFATIVAKRRNKWEFWGTTRLRLRLHRCKAIV